MGDHWNVPAYHYDPEGCYDEKSPSIRNPFFSKEVEYRHCDHMTLIPAGEQRDALVYLLDIFLIKYSHQQIQLFDLDQEPSELNDLSEDVAMQETLQALRTELGQYRDLE